MQGRFTTNQNCLNSSRWDLKLSPPKATQNGFLSELVCMKERDEEFYCFHLMDTAWVCKTGDFWAGKALGVARRTRGN